MRGPIPDDAEVVQRRNKPTIPTTNLPVSGYRGEFPAAPGSLDEELVDAYVELWRSPMAAAWIVEDAALVVELVRTRRAVDRVLSNGEFPPGTATGRISGIEDKLGLSPKARAQLRWRIVDDPPEVDVEAESAPSRFEEFGEVEP